MKLEARTYTADEWNDNIILQVEAGELREVKNKNPGFLMFGQTFKGCLVDKDGNKYLCIGWNISGSLSVEVKKL